MTNVADTVGLVSHVRNLKMGDFGIAKADLGYLGALCKVNWMGFVRVCFWVRCWPVQLQWQRRKLVRLDSPIFVFLGALNVLWYSFHFRRCENPLVRMREWGLITWARNCAKKSTFPSSISLESQRASRLGLKQIQGGRALNWSLFSLSIKWWLVGHRGVYQEMHWCGNRVVFPVHSKLVKDNMMTIWHWTIGCETCGDSDSVYLWKGLVKDASQCSQAYEVCRRLESRWVVPAMPCWAYTFVDILQACRWSN